MKPRALFRIRAGQHGFSLVELMVACVIGIVGVLAMYKTFAVWESRRRNVSAGSDSQVAGTVAIFSLDRDLKLAGMGFGTVEPASAGCDVVATNAAGANMTFKLAPIVINDGGANGPDTLIVTYGNSAYLTAGQNFDGSTATSKHLTASRAGFQQNDLVVVTRDANCALIQVSGVSLTDANTINHIGGPYNAAGGTGNMFSFPGSGGVMFNLGPAPQSNEWSIIGNSLSSTNKFDPEAGATTVAENVADLQAEYGVDANNDSVISDCEWTATAPTASPNNWTRLVAVRVGLLFRSQDYDPTYDAGAVATNLDWSGGITRADCPSQKSPFVMKNLDGSATATGPNDWRHYRYRVQETTVSLRNVLWGLPYTPTSP